MSYDLKVRCQNCDRFMPIKASKTSDIEVKCSDRKCKQWNKIKVVMLSDMIGKHTHKEDGDNNE